MKKIIPILLALLLLAGCGAAPTAESDPPAETAAPEPTAAPSEEPEAVVQLEPSGEIHKITELTPAPEPAEPGETVTLNGVDAYLRMTLPEGWTWEQGRELEGSRRLVLSAPTEDGFQIEAIWWESFGMCGTGVEFRELELSNGLTATLATEGRPEEIWWTLILQPGSEWFTLQLSAPQERIDAHQAEIDALLASLKTGVLAEIPPQPRADS